jgi:hypothetical protein
LFAEFGFMYFDILMPTILFIVTLAAVLLGTKAESKLKTTVEEREFRNRDVALMVVMIAAAVSVVVFIPSMAIMAVFLFSYSSLLFTVSYAFSGMKIDRLTMYCGVFIGASLLAAVAGFLGLLAVELRLYGLLAFGGFAACSFFAMIYARRRKNDKLKWYLAALSPALFLLLFFFYRETSIWFPYLLDVYGIIFAMLIVMYLGTMFNWKTVFIFAAFLTAMDIVLVWVTGTMVQTANAVSGLGLPVLVAFPTIPLINTTQGILIMRLGLGDFFFAGILGTQTLKKFDKKTGIISLLAMSVSFGIFELILLNPELANALPVKALPATLPIVVGWLPVIALRMLISRKQKPTEQLQFATNLNLAEA